VTGAITPVEVSLCAHARTSAPPSAAAGPMEAGSGASPASAEIVIGSARNGAPVVTAANFWENSPKVRCSARRSTSPKAAASQNAVAPPLPSATS
jgi:hypothetical protein